MTKSSEIKKTTILLIFLVLFQGVVFQSTDAYTWKRVGEVGASCGCANGPGCCTYCCTAEGICQTETGGTCGTGVCVDGPEVHTTLECSWGTAHLFDMETCSFFYSGCCSETGGIFYDCDGNYRTEVCCKCDWGNCTIEHVAHVADCTAGEAGCLGDWRYYGGYCSGGSCYSNWEYCPDTWHCSYLNACQRYYKYCSAGSCKWGKYTEDNNCYGTDWPCGGKDPYRDAACYTYGDGCGKRSHYCSDGSCTYNWSEIHTDECVGHTWRDWKCSGDNCTSSDDSSYSACVDHDCGKANGTTCSADIECCSGNCAADYDGSGQWCAPAGYCVHSDTDTCDATCYGYTAGTIIEDKWLCWEESPAEWKECSEANDEPGELHHQFEGYYCCQIDGSFQWQGTPCADEKTGYKEKSRTESGFLFRLFQFFRSIITKIQF